MVDKLQFVTEIAKFRSGMVIVLKTLRNNLAKYLQVALTSIGIVMAELPEQFSRLKYYVKIWFVMSKNSFLMMMAQKKLFLIFLFGKVVKFSLFLAFIYFILQETKTLAGYTLLQTLFFFLTYNFIDIVSQFFYREVYRFRPLLISGDFDLILAKPFNSLFRVLMGGSDIIDLVTIPPITIALIYMGSLFDPSAIQVFSYILLIVNGFIIATAFHIAVIALGIITLEIDHTIMIYRDLTDLGKFPIEIYREPVKSFLTYIIPVGLMITLPVKALLGLVSFWGIVGTTLFGLIMIALAVKFWNVALKSYTSASS